METTIKHSNGVIGNVLQANKYESDNELYSKYLLLKNYASQTQNYTRIVAGGIGESSEEVASTTGANILNFLSKMEKFYFNPPSDNLWTIHITLDESDKKLLQLYKNIIAVNESWQKKIHTKWKISTNDANNTSQNTAENFIKEFQDNSGLFLAQSISFNPLTVSVSDSPWSIGSNHGSFLNFGTTTLSRSDSKKLNISFLVSNWDIGDILFEPWIAAIAQKGLLEDETPSIKATIIVSEFSKGIPKEYNKDKNFLEMECRKQYIFRNCFPISRDEIEKKYNPNDAGVFKTKIINFKFDDYQILYKY